MLSSHRLFCTATHTGHGMFGAPTGKPVQFRAIAECHVKNGVIDDEWLTRDTGAVCRQLGRTAKDHARRLIDMQGGPSRAKRPFTPDQDRPGPYQGQGNDHVAGVRLAAILRSVMQTDLAVIRRDYDRASHPAPARRRHGPVMDRRRGVLDRIARSLSRCHLPDRPPDRSCR